MESSAVSDEKLTETWLTKMDQSRAIKTSMSCAICTIIFLLASFIPKSTVIKTGSSSEIVSPASTSYIRIQFNDYNPLSSIALFRISPKFVPAVVDRKGITIKIKGAAILLDDQQNQITELAIEQSITYNIDKNFDGYMKYETFLPLDTINFNSIIFYLDISTVNNIILDVIVTSISINRILPIIGVSFISIVTIANGILLVFLISKRMPPIEKDQWCIIFLSGILFFVDGPWLLCQYYAVPTFSRIFDILPQLFHGFFIIYTFIFFSSRSRETPKKIFNNVTILVCLFLMNLVIIVLEFTETKMKPLIGFAYYKTLKMNAMFIILLLIFSIYHISIIGSFIYGFYISKFERKCSFFLTCFMFTILEITQISTFLIRIFINEKLIGTSLAADVFYINEANIFCLILLYLNTPLSLSDDNVKPLIDQD